MSTTRTDTQPTVSPTLVLVADPLPWYAAAPRPVPDRQALEDEHTRVLAKAVGDHLPYELVLRAAALAAQLDATA
jgi:hypothetical protein